MKPSRAAKIVVLATLIIFTLVWMVKQCQISVEPATVLDQLHSPGGKFRAVLFTLDCGVPCDLENDVSIISAGDSLGTTSGTVLRSFADGLKLEGNGSYPVWLTLKWKSDHRLIIHSKKGATIEERLDHLVLNGERIQIDFVVD